MKSIIYSGPREQGFSSKVTLNKPSPSASVADPFGLVVMTSKKAGVSLSWGEVVLRVEEAAKASPQFLDPNPCLRYRWRARCPGSYNGSHVCERGGGHPGRCRRAYCGAAGTGRDATAGDPPGTEPNSDPRPS